MHTGQHAWQGLILEALAIDWICVQETDFQDSTSVIRLVTQLSFSLKVHQFFSEFIKAADRSHAGFGMTFSKRAKCGLLVYS